MRLFINPAIALWTVLATANAQTAGDPKLTVRVYDYAGISETTLARAEAAAQHIFRKAGIETAWVDCPKDRDEQGLYHACKGPGSASDVILKIVPEATRGLGVGKQALGLAISTAEGRPANHAYVFFGRVKQAVRQNGKVGLDTFLAYVMVHEFAHLLLGPDKHHVSGIMRPRWQPADLREMEIGRLVFPADQARELGARARERAVAETAAR